MAVKSVYRMAGKSFFICWWVFHVSFNLFESEYQSAKKHLSFKGKYSDELQKNVEQSGVSLL
jgi:hypothetical protein